MSTWGTTTPSQTVGRIEQALANPHGAVWLPAGATIDWAAVTAQSGDTTLADSTPVYDGEKAILRGTLMIRTATQEVNTWTLSGTSPTGNFIATLSKVNEFGQTVTGAYTLASATVFGSQTVTSVQAALDAFYGVGKATAVGTSTTVITITYSANLGNVNATTFNVTGMGGTNPAVTLAVTTSGVSQGSSGGAGGHWKPWASGALVAGGTAILNTTIKQANLNGGLNTQADGLVVGLLIGGTVWVERLTAAGSVPTAAAPPNATLGNILTVLPQLTYVYGDR